MTDTNKLANFKPLPQLRKKYHLVAITILFTIWLPSAFFIWMISTEVSSSSSTFYIILGWVTLGFIAVYILIYPLINKYFNSITYEIVADEIHVFRGFITKTRKIVPYRTITNLDVKQGPYDRFFDIGTIEIQTAGYSAQKTGPEERMDGLPADDVQAIQTYLLDKVRRVKGSAGAISHDAEGEVMDEESALLAILHEVKELRKSINNK